MSTDPLKRTFLGYYISALRGCCALKFLHALHIDQALLAHTRIIIIIIIIIIILDAT